MTKNKNIILDTHASQVTTSIFGSYNTYGGYYRSMELTEEKKKKNYKIKTSRNSNYIGFVTLRIVPFRGVYQMYRYTIHTRESFTRM